MNPEKWQEIKDKIKEKFTISQQFNEHDEERREDKEIIIFEGPIGKIKLEYITRPVILDKKTIYSRRIGSQVEVEYVYSDDEYTHSLKIYQFNNQLNDWRELRAQQFNI